MTFGVIMQNISDLQNEVYKTNPDYVVFQPQDLNSPSASNQHFIVFKGLNYELFAIWTQHTFEGAGNHHIVFSKSTDEGKTWQQPKIIAGCDECNPTRQASWAFPLLSKSGRIYVIYNKSVDNPDYPKNKRKTRFGWSYVTGKMEGIYSDDQGLSWSSPEEIFMPKSPLDNPEPNIPSNWIVWQKPERLSYDKYYVGFTRWVSPAVRHKPHNNSVHAQESVVEFMRFENIDDNPETRDINITFYAWGDKALRVPYYNNPIMSCAQEPSIVMLPDKRLIAIMRTMTGYLWYSTSSDQGLNWSNPKPLLYKDHGLPILHPLSCPPIYRLSENGYALFIHNNDGRANGLKNPEFGAVSANRRPIYICYGKYEPDAEQPLSFSEPDFFFDNHRNLGSSYSSALALYGSFTQLSGKNIFWYPDGKTFLLGKIIKPALPQ